MLKYVYIQDIRVPAYGLFVVMGVVVCCCIALFIAKKKQHKASIVLMLGIVGGIGAILGAKLLTLITTSMRERELLLSWNAFIKAGYSYYGGLFGFLLFVYVFVKIKKLDYEEYAKCYMFLLPLLQCFWKISCFMGGCCFGVPYNGIGAVMFPEGVNSLSGTWVFPVQLLEAFIALFIAISMIIIRKKDRLYWPISCYLVMYGTTRFIVEFLRYHKEDISNLNGYISSVISVIVGLTLIIIKKKQVGIE